MSSAVLKSSCASTAATSPRKSFDPAKEKQVLKRLSKAGCLEVRKIESDEFYQGTWTLIDEFEDIELNNNSIILVVE